MSFQSLGLSDALVRAVAEQGYTQPTPIQAQAIPAVLAGGDLLAGAQTGTGKTAGFVLPMLQRLSAHPAARATSGSRIPVRALIVAPTRELAAQVEASIRTYGKHLRFRSMALFGGVGFGPQAVQLKRGVDIVVATPGRLLDHANQTQPRPVEGRDPRPRRGRPDARHGLPAGHPPHPRAAAGEASEPAVLGDLPAGDPRARRELLDRRARSR
jgi:superfamily II DNA/RNA helicase